MVSTRINSALERHNIIIIITTMAYTEHKHNYFK